MRPAPNPKGIEMDLTITYSGLKEAMQGLSAMAEKMPEAIGQAIYEEAETIMTEAKELTPVDTGALRASGHVEKPEISCSTVTVELGFGGQAGGGKEIGYAFYVHENLEAHHTVGQAKFLETPLTDRQEDIQERIAKTIGEIAQETIGR
jgi:hypothetical protein